MFWWKMEEEDGGEDGVVVVVVVGMEEEMEERKVEKLVEMEGRVAGQGGNIFGLLLASSVGWKWRRKKGKDERERKEVDIYKGEV